MNAVNRVLLSLIGLGCVAAGALGVAATQGWVAEATINRGLPFLDAWDWWRGIGWGTGPLWALLGVAALVAVLALIVLILEATAGLGRDSRLILAGTPRGRTTMDLGRLRDAVAHEAARTPGVSRASVDEMSADPGAGVRLRLRTEPGASVPEVGSTVVERAAASLARMLDRPVGEVTALVEVRSTGRTQHSDRRVE